jgi:hypothetical protein
MAPSHAQARELPHLLFKQPLGVLQMTKTSDRMLMVEPPIVRVRQLQGGSTAGLAHSNRPEAEALIRLRMPFGLGPGASRVMTYNVA